MIRSFKLYAEHGKLWSAFLEYGSQDSGVTLDQIAEAIKALGIDEYNTSVIEESLSAGEYATIKLSEKVPADLPGACWMVAVAEEDIVNVNIAPPHGQAGFVARSEVIEELKEAGFGDFFLFEDVIKQSLQSQEKDHRFATFKAAEARNCMVAINTSNDKRAAYMTFRRPWGSQESTHDIVLAKLSEAGVVFGIDEKRIEEILTSNRDTDKQRIAGAKDAVDGEEAKLEHLFDAYHLHFGPRIAENDMADFRDLGLFENVEEGTALVQKTPATPGEDGTDVCGNPLKAKPGRDIPLPKGKNTRVNAEDENILEAAITGVPKLQLGKVIVDEVLIVDNVDFSVGNIDFIGDVLVKGIVHPGFTITAGSDITCMDTVEGANLKANGNIFLKRGIKGQGRSVLEAGQDVVARFIEKCTVIAGRALVVDEALIHCQASAIERVEAAGSKGTIFGGHITAGNLIRANFLGSEMAIRTELEVGVAPHIREQLGELQDEANKKKSDFERASKNLNALASMKSTGSLPSEREELFQTLTVATSQLKDEIEEISTNIAELQRALEQCAEGRVEAGKMIYSGVRITIKNVSRWIREPIKMALFLKEGGEVVLSTELAKAEE